MSAVRSHFDHESINVNFQFETRFEITSVRVPFESSREDGPKIGKWETQGEIRVSHFRRNVDRPEEKFASILEILNGLYSPLPRVVLVRFRSSALPHFLFPSALKVDEIDYRSVAT